MTTHGNGAPRKKRIWRISPDAPLGKFVDPDAGPPPLEALEPMERFEPGWRQSSFDLAFGLDVVEAGDTVPGDLMDVMDELFPKPAK